MTAVRGLALLTSNGKPITGISGEYKAVSLPLYRRHPDAVSSFSCNRYHHLCIRLSKRFTDGVCACGGNLQAARVSGINTTAIRISTFAIAACWLVCAAS